MTSSLEAFKCPEGGVHEWTYLGKARAAYRCKKCAQTVTKEWLKEETD